MKSLYFENSIARVLALKMASALNKNAAFGRFAPVQYGEIAEPVIPNGRWLKVKNIGCGLCGTDIHFLFMDMAPKCFPAALPGIKRKHLGHEVVSVVEKVLGKPDPEAALKKLQVQMSDPIIAGDQRFVMIAGMPYKVNEGVDVTTKNYRYRFWIDKITLTNTVLSEPEIEPTNPNAGAR